jgi:hypothetical protein
MSLTEMLTFILLEAAISNANRFRAMLSSVVPKDFAGQRRLTFREHAWVFDVARRALGNSLDLVHGELDQEHYQ